MGQHEPAWASMFQHGQHGLSRCRMLPKIDSCLTLRQLTSLFGNNPCVYVCTYDIELPRPWDPCENANIMSDLGLGTRVKTYAQWVAQGSNNPTFQLCSNLAAYMPQNPTEVWCEGISDCQAAGGEPEGGKCKIPGMFSSPADACTKEGGKPSGVH